MNILILTYGTRGDVQPFVALGKALESRGHVVTLAGPSRFEDFVAGHGLAFAGISDEMLALIETPAGKHMLENTRTILDSIRNGLRFSRRIRPMIRDQIEDSWAAAEASRPDVVVFHPKGFSGPTIAEAFECPAVLALPFPMLVPTGERPHLGFPSLPLGRGYNRFTHRAVNALSTVAMRGPLKALRARHGLPRAKRLDVLHFADGRRVPSLTAVSPSVVPEPEDWSPIDRMIGNWFLDESDGWAPPDDLVGFLQAGPAPVYVGFGSMAGKDPERLAEVVVEALRRSGQRGILATGWGGLVSAASDTSIFTIESAPHDWILPRTAAVVHHGGAGTTAAGLRAGVPSIVVPFMGDQPFWGERVEALGVGPPPIPQKRLTVARLETAIRAAVNDGVMRERAASLAVKIRAENGATDACRFVEEQVGC